MALGNVVGSNIFNVLFILGMSALIIPLTVASAADAASTCRS
jgi:cation:H+ antiporter